MWSASMPAAARSSSGLAEVGMPCTASFTMRGWSSTSAKAFSTASPRPPSGQWSSTVISRLPAALAAARSPEASMGLTE